MCIRILVGSLALASVMAGLLQAAELDPRYMPLSEVRPGMTGVGKTTLVGSEITEFEIVVLAVLKNVSPGRDLIMIRCRGAGLEETGVVAGMSGSPVYIEGRLVGAAAYAFQWSKAPIVGVQPIEQMLEVADRSPPADRPPSARRADADPAVSIPASALGDAPPAASGRETFQMRSIRTPLMVSGASPRLLAHLGEQLAPFGLVPMQGGAAPADLAAGARLEPGAPLAVSLVRGDMDVTAMGTITEVAGDRVYGFGHSLIGLGEADYPLMTGVAQTVVPSLAASFRLGAPAKEVGRLLRDEETAVFGRLGDERAPMVPLRVTVRGPGAGDERSSRYEVIRHRLFSPILASAMTLNSLLVRSEWPIDHTVAYRVAVKPVGRDPIVRENFAVSPDGAMRVMAQVRSIVSLLMENPFEPLTVESIDVSADVEPKSRLAAIETARLLTNAVRPGGAVAAELRIRPWRGEPFWMPLSVAVPGDYPEGAYRLTFCGADEALRQEARETPARFTPRDLEGLLWVLRHDLARNQLFTRLEAPGEGLAVGDEELPNLPPSMRAILSDAARLRVAGLRGSRVSAQAVPWVLSGEASLEVTVDRRAPE
ncbi:MAG: hypothetical protein NTX40_09290 [Planctomycetota bacterium]|nr:hypothetical protein [Planctomycetota bacterium]